MSRRDGSALFRAAARLSPRCCPPRSRLGAWHQDVAIPGKCSVRLCRLWLPRSERGDGGADACRVETVGGAVLGRRAVAAQLRGLDAEREQAVRAVDERARDLGGRRAGEIRLDEDDVGAAERGARGRRGRRRGRWTGTRPSRRAPPSRRASRRASGRRRRRAAPHRFPGAARSGGRRPPERRSSPASAGCTPGRSRRARGGGPARARRGGRESRSSSRAAPRAARRPPAPGASGRTGTPSYDAPVLTSTAPRSWWPRSSLICSYGRSTTNGAYECTTGRIPSSASPAATPIISCSRMPTLNRRGCLGISATPISAKTIATLGSSSSAAAARR